MTIDFGSLMSLISILSILMSLCIILCWCMCFMAFSIVFIIFLNFSDGSPSGNWLTKLCKLIILINSKINMTNFYEGTEWNIWPLRFHYKQFSNIIYHNIYIMNRIIVRAKVYLFCYFNLICQLIYHLHNL